MIKFMKKGISCFRNILFWFSILLISVLFLVILFFILKGDFCFYCDTNCSFSNWVLHTLGVLQPFRAIFRALLILLPIVIALETFHKNVNAQECQSLLELRKELSNNSNMTKHKELQKDYENITTNNLSINPEKYANPEIDNYLGTIELINIYLKKGIISEKEFHNQFGYRIDYISKNQHLMNYINSEHYVVWANLHELIELRKKININ